MFGLSKSALGLGFAIRGSKYVGYWTTSYQKCRRRKLFLMRQAKRVVVQDTNSTGWIREYSFDYLRDV